MVVTWHQHHLHASCAYAVDPLEDAWRLPGRIILQLRDRTIPGRFSLQRVTVVVGMHLNMV